ncbi:MAG: cytochrome C oxidase subunit II [Polyangiaceae bacterium]|nr:cytochrome C oxidase subunit II [Polyangiaceae bacterium]
MVEHYLTAASSYATDIDNLIWLVTIIVMPWFFLVQGILFYFLFKFKKKDGQKAQYITGEEAHQMRWVSVPHILVLLCDIVLIFGAIRVWVDIKQDMPTPDATVRIIAQQWAWTFVHPGPDNKIDTDDDIWTVDELHLENGQTYQYKLESRDVMHSFSVPVFRLKQDALPGRVISGWFKPIKEGNWSIQCAEMCGIGHGLMPARVIIESAAAHAAWISAHGPGKLAAATPAASAPAPQTAPAPQAP